MKVGLALIAVVQRLASCRQFDEVIALLGDATRELISADGVTVVLREGDFCYYVEENAIAPLWKGRRFPLKSCISGWCMLHRQAVAVRDIYTDERIPHDAYRPTFVKSLAMMPIRSHDPIGAIGGYWADYHDATQEELAVMQALGDSASVAIAHIQLVQQLRQTNENKDRFVMMLAHELRNPLAPMQNALHILETGDSSNRRAARQIMQRQVRHFAHIIDGLLNVSRINKGTVILQRAPTDLNQIARDCLHDRAGVIEGAGLTLHPSLAARPLWVNGDCTRLREVLDNLLDNAVKFSQAGKPIRVSLERQGEQAVLTVSDQGIGIEAEILASIFELFTQADSSLDRTRGGLGLGLFVAKSLVELHGGTIRAESQGPGRGALFEVRLPLDKSPPSSGEPVPIEPGPKAKFKILVAEDHRDSAESLRMLLRYHGHEVTVTHNGRDAIAQAAEFKPDVLLCDIGLPDLDGYAVARAIRQSDLATTTRLIAITGYGEEQHRQRAFESGFDFHLVKPIEPQKLFGYFEEFRS